MANFIKLTRINATLQGREAEIIVGTAHITSIVDHKDHRMVFIGDGYAESVVETMSDIRNKINRVRGGGCE